MKRVLFLGLFVLSACGGGGGGTPPTNSGSPRIANTALSAYLPLTSGNSWTFSSGGKMVDLGSSTLTCSCPASGVTMERIALYPPGSSTVSGSFFVTKNTPSGGTQLTNMVGVENDAGTTNITIASIATYPDGIPFMDDSPRVNEQWTDGVGDTSAITSVGGTLMLSNGEQVVDVATDQITGSFNPITWSFAKGVGFTSIGVSGQNTSITSFSVNAASSYSRTRQAVELFRGSVGVPDVERVLKGLF